MVRCRWTGQLLYVMCELSEYSNDKSLPSLKRHLTRVFRRVAQHDRYKQYASRHGQDAAGNPSGGNLFRGLYNIVTLGLTSCLSSDLRGDRPRIGQRTVFLCKDSDSILWGASTAGLRGRSFTRCCTQLKQLRIKSLGASRKKPPDVSLDKCVEYGEHVPETESGRESSN